jgi:pyruvate kinase
MIKSSKAHAPEPAENLEKISNHIDELIGDSLALEKKFASEIKLVNPAFRKSAKNLLHYLALRRHDIRDLQEQLATMGLSSLGRAEGHVLASLQAVQQQLCFLRKCEATQELHALSFPESTSLLKKHTEELLGLAPVHRNTRIMVTFSAELATDFDLICRLLQAGMDCARINCAHDDKATWLKMVNNIRRAEKELNISCKILFDLMGPKLRTGALNPGPALISVHPTRNELGQVVAPGRVWLTAVNTPPVVPVDAVLPVKANWLGQLQEGDQLQFQDTRGRKRAFTVYKKEENGVLLHVFKTSYIATGTKLKFKTPLTKPLVAEVGSLPLLVRPIVLKKDHFMVLDKEPIPGKPAQFDAQGHLVKPAHISCTLPEVFKKAKPGQPIMFDDGKIEGEITEVKPDSLLVKITRAGDKGSKLRADKGINLPETNLQLIDLTEQDKEDLAFVVKHADIVNLSFVNRPETVFALQEELKKHDAGHLAIMLKIETREAFQNLPHLLLAAMRSNCAGIMIARGDLAVECGWQRLAEVQEEILWLCEAAHLPVVWATQVLETLAKKGRPSRAEITDAAMGQRADCVMLNKGPHIVSAITLLDDILTRMQEHQHKKTSMLRGLNVSQLEHFYENQANKS